MAFVPQTPGHGSTHFWLTHALSRAHSELTTHSGRQLGGVPINIGKHEQTACSLISLHWLFGPQGDGEQGWAGAGGIAVNNERGIR